MQSGKLVLNHTVNYKKAIRNADTFNRHILFNRRIGKKS